jgi:hypothetical protein
MLEQAVRPTGAVRRAPQATHRRDGGGALRCRGHSGSLDVLSWTDRFATTGFRKTVSSRSRRTQHSPRGWRSAAATFTCVSILSPVGRYLAYVGRASASAPLRCGSRFRLPRPCLPFRRDKPFARPRQLPCLHAPAELSRKEGINQSNHVGNGRIRDVAAGPAARSNTRVPSESEITIRRSRSSYHADRSLLSSVGLSFSSNSSLFAMTRVMRM